MKNAKQIQTRLKELGLYKSRVDGDFGVKSRLALASFQRMHPPLIADGIYGPNTEKEMFFSIDDRNKPIHITLNDSIYPHESECMEFYGKPGSNQTKITLPYNMRLAWDERRSVRRISCHKKVAEDMQGILEDTLRYYGKDQIRLLGLDMFGGCLNVRKIRGGSRWSTHSWGIAMDIDPAHNQLRWHSPRARLSKKDYEPFWSIVEAHGATSLGREKDYDWMHFQFCHR